MPRNSFLRSLGTVAIICILTLIAEYAGVFSAWNRGIGDARMAYSAKKSDGQVVLVAVDAESLSEIGTWPWSREIHATILDRLMDGGAIDVLFDFDFSFPADAAGDLAFKDALDRAGGGTYLAVFAQQASATQGSPLHFNIPMPDFERRSWPALVNIGTDPEGLVRSYPFGAQLGDLFVSSAGALLSGVFGTNAPSFEIDFSIQPETIRVVSAIEVINGNFPIRFFDGRSVIVGASAVELSDQLAVPVHGVVPGPMIHVLAAETLLRDLAPRKLRPEVVAVVLLVLLTYLHSGLRRNPWLGLGLAGGGVVFIELCSIVLFQTSSIQVPSAMLYPSLTSFGLLRLAQAVNLGRWLLQKADIEARNTLQLLTRVFEDSSDGIVILDENGSVLRHSASAEEMFGTDVEGHLNLPEKLACSKFLDGDSGDPPRSIIEVSLGDSNKLLEFKAKQSDVELPLGHSRKTTTQKVTTLVLRDITILKEQEQDIAYLSNYDERTGALRRGTFLAFLGLRLEDRPKVVVFAVTLNRFKTINVTLGRNIGDELLREVVARLERSHLELSATARLGGTSFAFYTEGHIEDGTEHQLAERVLEDLSQPYQLNNANAHIGVSGGFVVVEEGSDMTAAEALEQAEEAMDLAKQSGNGVARYNHTAWQKQKRAREVERAMEDALDNNEFFQLYQPQHRISDGAMVGAEALLRWNSPKLGKVYPDEFIEIAESSGYIAELGKWSLERAATDAQTWLDDLKVSVNVSGIQVMRGDFASDVVAVLEKTGLPARRLCLELTETVLLASTEGIVETMQDLSFIGVTWALDDFGTGFSSMEYLSRMPLDKIKLDKSFTMRLDEDDPTARPILHSTGELCRGLGVNLLCEGVETAAQLSVLTEEGCAEAQGYYFGKPMPVDQLLRHAQMSMKTSFASPDQ